MVQKCDGLTLPEFSFHDYKKVMPNASGLNFTPPDPQKIIQILYENHLITYQNLFTYFLSEIDFLDMIFLENFPPLFFGEITYYTP